MLLFKGSLQNKIGGRSHRSLIFRESSQFSIKSWQETGNKEKITYKINCKWLIIKWTQLGSNLDNPLRKCPVDIFRVGLDCRGGSRPVGYSKALKTITIVEGTLLKEKSPAKCNTLRGFSGPSWARTIDPLIMSFKLGFPYVYTDLYVFVPV